MNTQLFEQFAEIRRQKEALEFVEEQLKVQILKEMQDAKKTSEKFDYGNFAVISKKNYVFRDNVKKLEENWKIAKIKAIEKNEVEVTETTYITFKPAKAE